MPAGLPAPIVPFLWLQEELKGGQPSSAPWQRRTGCSQHPCSSSCKTPGDHWMAAASRFASFLGLRLVTEGLGEPEVGSPNPRGCKAVPPIALAAPQASSAAGKGQPEGSGEALGDRSLGQLPQPPNGQ